MLLLQLRTFKLVIDCGSFSKAAKALHMTQSAVSQHIHSLENYFGVKLINRLYRSISLTAAGERLYSYAGRFEQLQFIMEQSMQEVTEQATGHLQLGASYTIGEYVLPSKLAQYCQKYGQVECELNILNTDQVVELTLAGKLDLGFIEGLQAVPSGVHSHEWGGDSLLILAGPTWQGPKGTVSLTDLLQETWVLREKLSGTRQYFENFLAKLGLDTLKQVQELGSSQAIKGAVRAGMGLTALSELTVKEEVERKELQSILLKEGKIQRKFHVIWHKEKALPYAAKLFLNSLQLKNH